MTRFAFLLHPLTARQAARKYAWARWMPEGWIERFLRMTKPTYVSHITGVKSITGVETEGWFFGVPLTPRMMTGSVPVEESYALIVEAARMAADVGAEIMGLGAFTSVVGDGGITIAERSPIAITTGNSYTVATAIEGTLEACRKVGVQPCEATLAVVGATGSIGNACARVLAPNFAKTWLVGRDEARTQAVADQIPGSHATVDLDVLRHADAVVTVTSAGGAIVEPHHLKSGAVVCDVSRPRDVSVKVAEKRPDVLVIEGGVVKVPGAVDFGFDFGFPKGTAYACMSETMMLALEGRAESYTVGKEVQVEKVEETRRWATKHGFQLAGFRSFEREVDEETISRIRAIHAKAG
ncbi:MAG: hypothetical protein KIT11_01950 [Fimbriimonadaceae bacterium]|nr:hypothetical protein [Fimbriimonadaceae bacterium]QYK54866.1 MAG: hypothetical protein KF733_07585 [Fimbriimonadaceae bacterium]